MDQSQGASDVIDTGPGIYDAMLPIPEEYCVTCGFVMSCHIDVGAFGPDQRTDRAVSKPYCDGRLAVENDIGSYSNTPPSDTNPLPPDTVEQVPIDQRVPACADIGEHGTVRSCPYCVHDDASHEVLDASGSMTAARINTDLVDAQARTDPAEPDAVDAAIADPVGKAVPEPSCSSQFDHSAILIGLEAGTDVANAAVPACPSG